MGTGVRVLFRNIGRYVVVILMGAAVSCLDRRSRSEFLAMVEREGMRSHEAIMAPAQPGLVEDFVGRYPGEAYGVCVDVVKKNLRPAREEEYRAADLAIRCVAASGDRQTLSFLEWVAFQSTVNSTVAGQALYFIGRLAPEKNVWALEKRLEMESYYVARSTLSDRLLSSHDPRAAEALDAAANRETDESVRRQMVRDAYLLRHPERCVFLVVMNRAGGEVPSCVYVCADGSRRGGRSEGGRCLEYVSVQSERRE